jgi:hypothetical protein
LLLFPLSVLILSRYQLKNSQFASRPNHIRFSAAARMPEVTVPKVFRTFTHCGQQTPLRAESLAFHDPVLTLDVFPHAAPREPQ